LPHSGHHAVIVYGQSEAGVMQAHQLAVLHHPRNIGFCLWLLLACADHLATIVDIVR